MDVKIFSDSVPFCIPFHSIPFLVIYLPPSIVESERLEPHRPSRSSWSPEGSPRPPQRQFGGKDRAVYRCSYNLTFSQTSKLLDDIISTLGSDSLDVTMFHLMHRLIEERATMSIIILWLCTVYNIIQDLNVFWSHNRIQLQDLQRDRMHIVSPGLKHYTSLLGCRVNHSNPDPTKSVLRPLQNAEARLLSDWIRGDSNYADTIIIWAWLSAGT